MQFYQNNTWIAIYNFIVIINKLFLWRMLGHGMLSLLSLCLLLLAQESCRTDEKPTDKVWYFPISWIFMVYKVRVLLLTLVVMNFPHPSLWDQPGCPAIIGIGIRRVLCSLCMSQMSLLDNPTDLILWFKIEGLNTLLLPFISMVECV